MTPEARDELQRIGAELDRHRQVRVKDGGIVLPEPEPPLDAKVKVDERREQRQPRKQRQRESRERKQRESRERQQRPRRRASSSAAHVRGVELRSHYEAQVIQLAKAYSSARVVAVDEQGMWLQVQSAVLNGIDRSVTFLVVIPFNPDKFPKAWGFWNLVNGPQWIGKRHTNFPEGDVCAFVPESRAWLPGDDLDALLDLYTVWALRHLYLEEFKRWPGRQFSPHPYYALAEFKPDELCSCDQHEPPLLYGECCRPKHLAMGLLELKSSFEDKIGFSLNQRIPPKAVLKYINDGEELPPPFEVVSNIASAAAKLWA
jgi:hypothetical protein